MDSVNLDVVANRHLMSAADATELLADYNLDEYRPSTYHTIAVHTHAHVSRYLVNLQFTGVAE